MDFRENFNLSVDLKLEDIINVVSRFESFPRCYKKGLTGSGVFGLILLCSYYQYCNNSNLFFDKLSKSLLFLQKKISEQKFLDLSFSNGIIGFSWMLNHLESLEIFKLNSKSFYRDVDLIAYKFSLKQLSLKNYDLFEGSIGAGIYLLDRLSNKLQYNYLNEILKHHSDISIKSSKGIIWEDVYLSRKTKKTVYNLGLSHGLASHIVFYCKMLIAQVNTKLCTQLLKGSIDFLLNYRYSIKGNATFPSFIINEKPENSSRLAWCYGDLGISIALWQAGNVLNDNQLKNEAINVCLNTINWKNSGDTKIFDAGLCHGTSGVAHIYNRMYRYTGRKEFQYASNYWIKETITIAKFDDGLAGFKTLVENGKWENNYGILEGISGIGLALLSFNTPKNTSWDKFLLLS